MLKFTLNNIQPPWEGIKHSQQVEKKFPNTRAETVNWWKPKVQSPPPPSSPLHHRLHEAFHSLQSHVSSFLQKPQTFFNHIGRKSLAMSNKEIGDQLSMTPVYGIKVSCEESVQMVSPIDERKSLLGYFFSKADAMAFGEYTFSTIPLRENFVVSEALDDVLDYHIENGPIRLLPDAYEVKNALQVKKKSGHPNETFSGIPVFESRNLSICDHYLCLTNEGCRNQRRPVFFKKDDLERSLAKARAAAGQEEGPKLIDTEVHIEVAALEDIIRSMKDNSTSEWNNVFFAYPGEDIRTGPSPCMERKRGDSVIFNP